jgi:hypothetical protein
MSGAVEVDLSGGSSALEEPASIVHCCIQTSPDYRSVHRLRVDGDASTVGGAPASVNGPFYPSTQFWIM